MPSIRRFLPILLCSCFLFSAALAAPPAGKRLTVVIRDGKPDPQNVEINDRKTDTLFLQNTGAIVYKIVWTDKNYGSPFMPPGTPNAKATITIDAFGTKGPLIVNTGVKSGQRYSYDVIGVRAGKESRAGGGSVVVQ